MNSIQVQKIEGQNKFDCPISKMLRVASAKWTLEILRECAIQPTRTRQFLARIPGLSMKCLQERLKELEALKFINRVKYPDKLPKVEHSLTERGRKLLKIMIALKALEDELAPSECRCPLEPLVLGFFDAEASCPARKNPALTPVALESFLDVQSAHATESVSDIDSP